MESAIYSMWAINIRNLVQNKIVIAKDFHIQPSEIDRMTYYEYEWLVEDINEYVKKEKENESAQSDQYKMPNMSSFANSFKSSIPKMNIPNFKI